MAIPARRFCKLIFVRWLGPDSIARDPTALRLQLGRAVDARLNRSLTLDNRTAITRVCNRPR